MYHSFLIHSSADGHLGCFHVLAIINSAATEWSKPERKTPIQYTNTYIWNLERWQWWPCRQDRKKDIAVYNGLLDSKGEGEGGMIWENGVLTCILSCKYWIASLCLTQDTECLGPVHGDDPQRCYGEGGGRGFHVWEHM